MRPEDLQTPTLLIDLDAVRHNLATMRHYLDGQFDRWRPHVKTCKVPEVLALLLREGVRRFKVATTRECEVLLAAAGRARIDVLMATAQHGANLQRFAALAHAHSRHSFAMLSEDPGHAAQLRELTLGVVLDLDPGYHRTGVRCVRRISRRSTPPARRYGLHC
jgi:D-serine deaminase-like pyridoxal phosphate-dependent protein